MVEETDLEKCNFQNFRSSVTLTLTSDRVIWHTVVHQSSTSIYKPNCIEIGKTFLQTYLLTDISDPVYAIRLTRGSRPKKLEAKDVLLNINCTQAAERPKMSFFVPGDLDLQTRQSEGRNMSSVWNWCKSIQRFRRYFIHELKNHRLTAPKTEPSAVHCVR